jgi:hypothetical protein
MNIPMDLQDGISPKNNALQNTAEGIYQHKTNRKTGKSLNVEVPKDAFFRKVAFAA